MRINRNRIIAFILLVCFGGHAAAQSNFYEEDPKVFTGGLILGANFAQVDGDNYYGYHRFGLNTGASVYIHFTTKLGVSIELLYSQKGSRGESVNQSAAIGTYVAKYYMNLNYAEIPLTLHYIYRGLDMEAGISYARLVKSSEWIQADYQVKIDPVANRFENTDLEYVFGIGHKIYKKLYANARFQYSIISVRPNDRIPVDFGYGNAGQWNNIINLRLIYVL